MNSGFVRRRVAAAALPLLLAACASIAPPATQKETASVAARPFHEAIDLAGRLSVRYQHDGKEEALHGSFMWNQGPDQTTVTLLSPLGQTMAIVTVSPAGATLLQGRQPMRSAADVDALTAETLGWPLPVAQLRNWLQGFAIDRQGKRFVATPQADQVQTRDGWQIRYASWMDMPSQNLPKRIDLARNTEQAGDVSIRIAIDTWQAR